MWVKIDDGLPAHRKTRAVLKSHEDKTRDVAPLGLWVVAAAWAGKHGTEGWVPLDELDRWDDDYEVLVNRLVLAGFWWPQERDGEHGYGFNDWHDYNDPADMASKAGTFGNHVRWHVNEGKVDPSCEHCPKEPDEPEDRGDIAPDIGGRSGGESPRTSGAIALPEPEPDPNPTRTQETLLPDKSGDTQPERFDEFWNVYDHKVGRKKAMTAYRAALKKPGVTPDLLIAAAGSYVAWVKSEGKHPEFTKHPTTWLHGEHWTDERAGRAQKPTRIQEHLTLVQQLEAEERAAEQATPREIGQRR